MDEARRTRRLRLLESSGASAAVARELIEYDNLPYARDDASALADLPMADEPLVETWRGYAAEARSGGVFDTLRRHLVQLRFPVERGISDTDAYRRATRRGDFTAAEAGPGLRLYDPDSLELTVPTTMAGGVPVIVAGDRRDFVLLVQALTSRNEPVVVPDAMGACLVKGLNNWSRVAAYKSHWSARTGESGDAAWAVEFQRLIPQKALYQDRVILLSRGPYSATPASAVDLSDAEWLGASLAIRREHELTHCFTHRVFGSMRTHVVDELVADFVGLALGYGGYRADLALRFLGLEDFPRYRTGGRLEHYRGPLSDAAFATVQALTVRAAHNLETFANMHLPPADDLKGLGEMTLALIALSLEELASDDLATPAVAEGS